MIKDDRDDFMGSCNLSLTQVKKNYEAQPTPPLT